MNIKKGIKNAIHFVSEKTRKRTQSNLLDVDVCHCSANKINHIASSNNIIVFEEDGKNYYFKECRKHNRLHDYLFDAVDDYFSNIRRNDNDIKSIVTSDLQKKENLNAFTKLFDYSASHYEIINHYDGWDTNVIGLPTLFIKMKSSQRIFNWMNEVFPNFIEYIRNEIDAYNLNRYLKNGQYQLFRASLSIATRKMAVLLGISDMVPDTRYIKLIIDNNIEKFGIVTQHVEGISPLTIEDRKLIVTPMLQQQLNVLHLFDVICFQRDHSLQNYFVTMDDFAKADKVIAYDNDSPQAFYPIPIINFSSCLKCSSVTKGGIINRPYIDKTLCEKILTIKNSEIKKSLQHVLSGMQVYMLCIRVKRIKNSIIRTQKKYPDRFINIEDWNQKTIEEELSGNYGKTYLMHFMNNDERELAFEIMNR